MSPLASVDGVRETPPNSYSLCSPKYIRLRWWSWSAKIGNNVLLDGNRGDENTVPGLDCCGVVFSVSSSKRVNFWQGEWAGSQNLGRRWLWPGCNRRDNRASYDLIGCH